MAIFVFTGMVALVIDVSWYWVNSLRVQRAADAAALAGVVQLPTNPAVPAGPTPWPGPRRPRTATRRRSIGHPITPVQEPAVTGRRLAVTITAPVDMFFMRIFGINEIMSTRIGRAEYVLPVPMGSPDNYYGVFGEVRGLHRDGRRSTSRLTPTGDSGLEGADRRARRRSGTHAWALHERDAHHCRRRRRWRLRAGEHERRQPALARLRPALRAGSRTTTATDVNGIEVELTDASVDLGLHRTRFIRGRPVLGRRQPLDDLDGRQSRADDRRPHDDASTDYTLGSTSSLSAWPFSPGHTWTGDDLGNSNFRASADREQGPARSSRPDPGRHDRGSSRLYEIDRVTPTPDHDDARRTSSSRVPGTPCPGVADCFRPTGRDPQPQRLLGNDEHRRAPRTSTATPTSRTTTTTLRRHTNPDYDASTSTTTRSRCRPARPAAPSTSSTRSSARRRTTREPATAGSAVTGDPVSSFYELYDTQGTLYDIERRHPASRHPTTCSVTIDASDTTMGGRPHGTPARVPVPRRTRIRRRS